MVQTTILARVSDGMPLAASMEDEKVILDKGGRRADRVG